MNKMSKILLISLLSLNLVGCGEEQQEVIMTEEQVLGLPIHKTIVGNKGMGYFTIPGDLEKISEDTESMVYQGISTGIVVTLKKYDTVFSQEDVDYVRNLTEKNLSKSFKEDISVETLDFLSLGSVVNGTLIRATSSYNLVPFNMDIYLIHTETGTIYLSLEGFTSLENVQDYTQDLLEQFILLG